MQMLQHMHTLIQERNGNIITRYISNVIISYHPLHKTNMTYSKMILTFQAPIQKPYQSLDPPSFSRKHSPMWEQFPPARTDADNLVNTIL